MKVWLIQLVNLW